MKLPDYLVRECLNPDWEAGSHIHNWRNHIPEQIRVMWDTFTRAQKLALTEWADDLAGEEHWE